MAFEALWEDTRAIEELNRTEPYPYVSNPWSK
jgi:hypothetical protein